jgi:type III secretion protein O
MDVLNDLLKIKVFREQKAERALVVARQRLRMAEAAVRGAKETLREFQQESARRERKMYAELCARLVLIRDIDSVHIDVQLMKEREAELVQQLVTAESERDEAALQEREAREHHEAAVRMREKFSEMLRVVREEQEFERALREELEIEEAAEVRFQLAGADDEYTGTSAGAQA